MIIERIISFDKKAEQSIPRLLKFEPMGKENQNSNKTGYVKHNKMQYLHRDWFIRSKVITF